MGQVLWIKKDILKIKTLTHPQLKAIFCRRALREVNIQATIMEHNNPVVPPGGVAAGLNPVAPGGVAAGLNPVAPPGGVAAAAPQHAVPELNAQDAPVAAGLNPVAPVAPIAPPVLVADYTIAQVKAWAEGYCGDVTNDKYDYLRIIRSFCMTFNIPFEPHIVNHLGRNPAVHGQVGMHYNVALTIFWEARDAYEEMQREMQRATYWSARDQDRAGGW